jgi:hypothetical protein
MTLLQMRTKVRELLGNITTAKYSDDKINTAINNYKDTFVSKAIMSNGQWEFNGEVSTTDIVANQREYVLPTDLLSLKRVEANLMTGAAENQWTNVRIIDMRSIPQALTNQQDSDDTIESAYEIRVFDESLFFNWLPKNSVTGGLKIYHQIEETDYSADGDVPEFPQSTHIGLVYGACLDYSLTKERSKSIANFKSLYEEKEQELIDHYSNRLPAVRTALQTRQEKYI